jgi:hypothetical protein
MQGYGVMLFPNGDKYDGAFFDDHWHGKGVWSYDKGYVYTGVWDMDQRHGVGELFDPDSGL